MRVAQAQALPLVPMTKWAAEKLPTEMLAGSFAMISGSALLTSAFSASERASVQGAADFTMVASGATGGLLSGVIVEASSYHALSHWAAVLALSLVAAALYPVVTKTKPRKTAAA